MLILLYTFLQKLTCAVWYNIFALSSISYYSYYISVSLLVYIIKKTQVASRKTYPNLKLRFDSLTLNLDIYILQMNDNDIELILVTVVYFKISF